MRRVLFFPAFLCIAVVVFAAEKPLLEASDENGGIVIRSDDDELIETFSENQTVRIQFDPKDQFFRLTVNGKSAFEFVIAAGLPALPETLPMFEEAKQHAASVDAPKVRR